MGYGLHVVGYRYITKKKRYLDQIGHISYYLHIALQ